MTTEKMMDRPWALPGELSPRISEETANCFTHGLGLALSLIGFPWLLQAAAASGDVWRITGCTVYGITLVALYAASTLSHSFHQRRLRQTFRLLDQVCIFLLIAGSFTPFALVHLRDGWWPALTVAVWLLALAGIAFKVFLSPGKTVAVSVYVLLGWLPALALEPMIENVQATGLAWILLGGLFYTAGTAFLCHDRAVRYFHAVWHIFVLAGSTCHYFFTLFFIAGG